MPAHSKATIIGVGLIGGSIGLAMRERKLAERVVGVGRRQSSLDRALEHQVIDEATTDLAAGVADADIVIVATPVDSVVDDVAKALAAAPKLSTGDRRGQHKGQNLCGSRREAASSSAATHSREIIAAGPSSHEAIFLSIKLSS